MLVRFLPLPKTVVNKTGIIKFKDIRINTMKFFIGVALLYAVFTSTNASSCTVCLHEHCYATSSFYEGHTKLSTGQMIMDYSSNTMYQYEEGINAINLDTNTVTTVPMQDNAHYFAVDQDTGDLYYYKNVNFNNTIYKYQPKTGQTEAINVPLPENSQPPLNLLIHNGSAYFNTHRSSGYDVANGLNILRGSVIERIPALENLTVNYLVFDKIGTMYIKSGPEMYRLKPNEDKPVRFIQAKYLISGDKNGEVYFFDPTNRFIYKLNADGDDLICVGAYDASRDGRKRPNLKEFMFDKNGNPIFKDKWSTLYYKATDEKCTFAFEEDRGRTRITKL